MNGSLKSTLVWLRFSFFLLKSLIERLHPKPSSEWETKQWKPLKMVHGKAIYRGHNCFNSLQSLARTDHLSEERERNTNQRGRRDRDRESLHGHAVQACEQAAREGSLDWRLYTSDSPSCYQAAINLCRESTPPNGQGKRRTGTGEM